MLHAPCPIGRKLATKLQLGGQDVVAASPSTGVNSLTGEGLKKVLTGANVVVDVTNSPSFEDNAVLDFFRSSTEHLLSAAKAAGVAHYIALSVVGSDSIRDSGYLRAKRVQEGLIEVGGIPYTVLRATQFQVPACRGGRCGRHSGRDRDCATEKRRCRAGGS
jgi:uncharacterized protein YbjT (DUF2867 family)